MADLMRRVASGMSRAKASQLEDKLNSLRSKFHDLDKEHNAIEFGGKIADEDEAASALIKIQNEINDLTDAGEKAIANLTDEEYEELFQRNLVPEMWSNPATAAVPSAAMRQSGQQVADPRQAPWTYIPPVRSGKVVERAPFIWPFGLYELPSGERQRSFALPGLLQNLVESGMAAKTGLGQALGLEQDPYAPQGMMSKEAIERTGQALSDVAATGGGGVGQMRRFAAPYGALASNTLPTGKVDPEMESLLGSIKKMVEGVEEMSAPPPRGQTTLAPVAQDLDPRVGARAARAVEQGYEDMPHFRGMRQDYDPGRAEFTPQWFSTNPEVASSYTGLTSAQSKAFSPGGEQVMPAYLRPGSMVEIDVGGGKWDRIPVSAIPEEYRGRFNPGESLITNQIVDAMRGPNQPDIVRFKNVMDHAAGAEIPSDVSVVLNPANIRSISAMFDPRRMAESDPLAANPITSLLPGAALRWPQPEEERRGLMP